MARDKTGIEVGRLELEAVHLGVAAQGAAGNIRVNPGELASTGHEPVVERVVGEKQPQLRNQAVVVQLGELPLMQPVHVVGPVKGVG